jgi:hypothetical protein
MFAGQNSSTDPAFTLAGVALIEVNEGLFPSQRNYSSTLKVKGQKFNSKVKNNY